ncbi:hypothetical protein C1646_718378 [Rhizophagus diaphanus]|nr:hypothetical protein C1646_718378 [Rhizophagus diaphanus] [Rhizophagus sp. MUCL 43196]
MFSVFILIVLFKKLFSNFYKEIIKRWYFKFVYIYLNNLKKKYRNQLICSSNQITISLVIIKF